MGILDRIGLRNRNTAEEDTRGLAEQAHDKIKDRYDRFDKIAKELEEAEMSEDEKSANKLFEF